MRRRAFLSTFLRGAAGAAVLASVPMTVVRAVGLGPSAHAWATNLLYTSRRQLPDTPNNRRINLALVSQQVYDAYEQELPLVCRFESTYWAERGVRTLRFKGVAVQANWKMSGTEILWLRGPV